MSPIWKPNLNTSHTSCFWRYQIYPIYITRPCQDRSAEQQCCQEVYFSNITYFILLYAWHDFIHIYFYWKLCIHSSWILLWCSFFSSYPFNFRTAYDVTHDLICKPYECDYAIRENKVDYMYIYILCVSKGHVNPNYCHWNGGLKPLFSECNVSFRKIYIDIDSNYLSNDQYCGDSSHNFKRVVWPPSSHQTIISWISRDESTIVIPLHSYLMPHLWVWECNIIIYSRFCGRTFVCALCMGI